MGGINKYGFDSSVYSDADYQKRITDQCAVDKNGCWLWQGYIYPNGYAGMSYRCKTWRLHRLAYFLWKGPIPEGHDICHTCDVRHCCNPDHLWSGPRQLNNRDTTDKVRNKNSQKTACPKGHPYSYIRPDLGYRGWRACSICARARGRIKAGWPEDLAYSLPAGTPGESWRTQAMRLGFTLTQGTNDG